jgi:haloalkane dehalogenase
MQDPVFDEVVLDHLLTLLPQAEVHRYADAGHYVLEDAADSIVPLASRLLAPA